MRRADGRVPLDAPDALAEAMRRLLTDAEERERRRGLGLARAAQFRWRAAAARMRACYAS